VIGGTALVTGAARGMGRAIALDLAAQGCSVAIHANTSVAEASAVVAEAAEISASHGFNQPMVLVQGDLTVASDAQRVVEEAAQELGSLSILINVVGNYHVAPIDQFPLDHWHDMFNSNLHATYYTCVAALPFLRQSGAGRIVNFGCAGALNLVARPESTAYLIAKTGVTLLTKAIAEQEAHNGITANVAAPGVIETSRSQPVGQIPLGRVGRVNEVVSTVRFFLSEEANYITGQTIEVAGGWKL
jgi:3-oxoacyl-[acyl-carrier protein] reductase